MPKTTAPIENDAEAKAIFHILQSAFVARKNVTRIIDDAGELFAQWVGQRLQKAHDDKLQRMADLIVDITRERGECTNHDLLYAGFTTDDLRRFGPMASGLAAVAMMNDQRGGHA